MLLFVGLALALLGLCLGSFAGALVWRLRARQLVADKKTGEPFDKKEYTQLHGLADQKLSHDRSRCLHCGYTLKWYDLIPLVSWIALKGRCRSCHKPIGLFEPLIEVGVAFFFVVSYLLWPVPLDGPFAIGSFGVWLAGGVVMALLFAYDLKWFLLPDKLNLLLAGLGVGSIVLAVLGSGDVWGTILSSLGAIGIISGLYLVLYWVSRGAWVGFGDIKLGVGLGLLLGEWQLALIALFLANFIGCLIVVPLLASKKLKRDSRIPFGPLLIAGTVIAKLIGWIIIDFYLFAFI